MTDITPPVIIDTGSELLVFSSIRAAESYLEPIDVENGEYRAAYDSRGQLLELEVQQAPERGLLGLLLGRAEHVKVRPAHGARNHVADLAERLRAYRGSLGAPVLGDSAPLSSLLEQLREHAGFTS